MKKTLLTSLAIASLIVIPGPALVQADFIENFDDGSYVSGNLLPSPWSAGPALGDLMQVSPADALNGFGGTQGTQGPSGSGRDAKRPSDYDTNRSEFILSYKARLSNRFGSIPRLIGGFNDGGTNSLDSFGWEMQSRGVSNFADLRCGGGLIASSSGCGDVQIDKGVWYEITVHLTESGGNWSFTSEYARYNGVTFDTPIAHGSGTLNAGFTPQNVLIESFFGWDETPNITPVIDDVSFVSIPEPASLVLAGAGLLALWRRRAASA
jgi:hypothetical protein